MRYWETLGSPSEGGHEVVGFDLLPFYLKRARKWASREGLDKTRARFYVGDSRDATRILSGNDETGFDAIVNMYTSHGYYPEEEDLRLFRELKTVESPRCLFVIETVNRDNLVGTFERFGQWDISPRLEWHETRKLNLETSWLENTWKFYEKAPSKNLKLLLELPMSLRVYSLHELKRVLNQAGWKFLKSYGSLQSQDPVTIESRHMTLASCAS